MFRALVVAACSRRCHRPNNIPLDLARRKRRGKRTRGHDVLGPDPLLLGVEIDEIAGAHIDCADATPSYNVAA